MHCMDNAQDTRYRWAGWGVTTSPRIMMVGDTQQLLQQSHVGLHNWSVCIWRRMYSNQCPVRWAVAQGHHIITWLNRRQLNLQGFTQLDARQSMCLVVLADPVAPTLLAACGLFALGMFHCNPGTLLMAGDTAWA